MNKPILENRCHLSKSNSIFLLSTKNQVTNSMFETINFYGLNISNFTREELWSKIDLTVKSKSQMVVHWRSLGTPGLIKKTPELLEITNNFDLLLVDGRGLFVFMKWMGYKLKTELYTSWFTLQLIEKAAENGYSVMVLGASEESNITATSNIKEKYGVKTVYKGINGYFTSEEEESVVDRINEVSPDILIVGISTPKKEIFANKYRNKLNTRIILLCGGMVDVIAGKTNITPIWIKKLGFAWLYRIIQEPKRLLKPVLSMVWEGSKFAIKILFKRI